MHPHLEHATAALGLELPALTAAASDSAALTRTALHDFKEAVGLGEPLDIVVCGSMARQEMVGASDFDYLIVAHGLVEHATKFRVFRRACDEWCTRRAIEPPGATGIFGKVISATELVDQIGLEADTNRSLTRRILLLEEGVSVLQPNLHRKFVSVALGRYLEGHHLDETGVPRFLLNDMSRYWRTTAVDYQAKVWERVTTSEWALRYLKLRLSRKLTFVGSLVPLFLVALREPDDVHAFLTDQFVDVPPLARLAQLTVDLEGDEESLEHLRAILTCADAFVEFSSDGEKRRQVNAIPRPDAAFGDPLFAQMQTMSSDLQEHLQALFFDSERLSGLSRKYLTF